ncbi:MAG: cell division protein FtsL [Gammaproteobacteria bacterium]|nr:cell division protein FtsL [Gammaproteobacteria bacterium]
MKWLKSIISQIEKALPILIVQKLLKMKWILVLGAVVWVNAISVAFLTHKTRQQTALLEHLKYEQYQLEMEWEALRLEQGTLAEHNRIENIARKNLEMKNVHATDEVLIRD